MAAGDPPILTSVQASPPLAQPPVLDRLLPVAVGQRTQLAALAILVVQVLGWFGALSPDRTQEVTGVLAPLALATLAAKVDRAPAQVAAVAAAELK
jgi:hypothetical protein